MSRREAVLALLLLLVTSTTACTSTRQLSYTPEELRLAVARRADVDPRSVDVPFVVPDAAVERVRSALARFTSPRDQAQELARLLMDDEGLGVVYDAGIVSATAEQTLGSRAGNCLGISSAYVGLARAVGLSAYYLDVSDRIRDLQEADGFIVSSGHVTAVVATDAGYTAIDFTRELEGYRSLRIMDDVQAYAHYFNNRGYELIQAARNAGTAIPWSEVRREFMRATRLNPSLARAWNNLSIAEARLRNWQDAEIGYRIAIELEPDFAEAHNNLGSLYLEVGRPERAVASFERSVALDPRNPFHRYHYALALLATNRRAEATRELEEVLSLAPSYGPALEKLAELGEEGGDR